MQGHRTSGTSDTRFFTLKPSGFASLGAVITSDAIHSYRGRCKSRESAGLQGVPRECVQVRRTSGTSTRRFFTFPGSIWLCVTLCDISAYKFQHALDTRGLHAQARRPMRNQSEFL